MQIQTTRLKTIILKASTFLLALALPACSSFSGYFKQADSPLPIEAVHAPSGGIASVRAFESSDKLYVAGSMQRTTGYAIHYAAHVDIELLNSDGQVLAEEQDDIDSVHPRRENARNRHYSYVASFPLSVARKAAKIRVTYHPATHAVDN